MVKNADKLIAQKKKSLTSGAASKPPLKRGIAPGKRRLKVSTGPADELKKAYKNLQTEVAERIKAEESAKAERQRFYDVLEMLPAYVVLLAPDYHVPFANRFFRERFGESHGRRCFEYLFHRTEPCDNCESYKVLKTGKPYHWEWTGPDNRDYDIFDYLFTDADGSKYIMEMGIDITERKRAEKALSEANLTLEKRVDSRTHELKESEDRYRNLFSTMTEGFSLHEIITDAQGNPCDYRFLDVNAAFETLTGLSRNKVIGRTVREIMPNIDRHWIENYGRVALTGEPVHFEQFANPLGRWYDCYAYSPSKRQFVVLFTDITARRAAEAQVTHLASFPEKNPMLVLEMDASGVIKYINPSAKRVFPDLPAVGKKHPFLADWDLDVNEILVDKGRVITREICVGDSWYEKTIYYEPSDDLFRIYGLDISVRKQAEDSLREAYELLEAVTRGTEVIIASIDTEHRYTYFNTAYRDEIKRLSGRDIRLGISFFDVFSEMPEQLKTVREEWSQPLRGETTSKTLDFGEPNRYSRTYRVYHTPIRDSGGNIVGAGEVAFDISQQVQDQNDLRETRDYLDNLFNYANAPIVVWDPEFKITRFNHAFEHLTGRKSDEVLGKQVDILIPVKSRKEAIDKIKRTAAKGEHWEIVEIPVQHVDGSVRIVLWNSATLFTTDGTMPIATIAQGQDITDRKQAEEKIALQARMLDAIMDSIIAFDIQGRIIYWGRGASLLLGWQPEEVMGHQISDVLIPRDSSRRADPLEMAWKKGERWSGEISVNRLDGTLAPLLVHISPVKDEKGLVIGSIAVGKDITELKKVDQLKDEFIGLVSHELRTPLTIINGAVRTAMDERITDAERNMLLEDAASGVEGLSNILNNLLELSRYQASRLKLDKKTVDVREITESTARKVNLQYPLRTLRLNIPDGLPPVLVDPVRLERIIYNLVDNAFKYSGSPDEVLVFAREDTERVVIGVTDHGPGIAPEVQADIFEPFVRLEETNKKGGIGLGLVVCKRLVEAHGGQIWLESTPGKGSTFFFSVPLTGQKGAENSA
jgi:PAS domain S-box-containing protein